MPDFKMTRSTVWGRHHLLTSAIHYVPRDAVPHRLRNLITQTAHSYHLYQPHPNIANRIRNSTVQSWNRGSVIGKEPTLSKRDHGHVKKMGVGKHTAYGRQWILVRRLHVAEQDVRIAVQRCGRESGTGYRDWLAVMLPLLAPPVWPLLANWHSLNLFDKQTPQLSTR